MNELLNMLAAQFARTMPLMNGRGGGYKIPRMPLRRLRGRTRRLGHNSASNYKGFCAGGAETARRKRQMDAGRLRATA